MRYGRRLFVAAALVLPLTYVPSAEALLPIPTRRPPPRKLPLGTWRLVDRRPEAEPDSELIVGLQFRSLIDVADPQVNWWPRSVPVTPFRPPPTSTPTTTPVRTLPTPGPTPTAIPLGHARRPNPESLGEELLGSIITPVNLTIAIGRSACRAPYLIQCEMLDPESNRNALFAFRIYVTSGTCPRPTGIPSRR